MRVVRPEAPIGTGGPTRPGGPVGPGGPTRPVGPGGPAVPLKPVGPCKRVSKYRYRYELVQAFCNSHSCKHIEILVNS